MNDVFAQAFGEQPADLIGGQIRSGNDLRTVVGVVKFMDYMNERDRYKQVFILSRSPGWPRTAFVVKVVGRRRTTSP